MIAEMQKHKGATKKFSTGKKEKENEKLQINEK
jgi:hypothetical protein